MRLIDALILDYLHRAGEGTGIKQAVVEYMDLVEGYSEQGTSRAIHRLEEEGLLTKDAEHYRNTLYSIDYDAMCEDDGQ